MSLRTPAQKTIAALALVLPLTLAACGSDGKEDTAAASSVAATASASANSSAAGSEASAAPSSEASEAPAPESSAAPAEGNAETPAAAEGADVAAAPVNPVQAIDVPTFQPLPSGNDDPAVHEQLQNLVSGMYSETRYKASVEYALNNSCEAIAAPLREEINKAGGQAGGWAQIPDDMTYQQVYDLMAQQAKLEGKEVPAYPGMPTFESISDVKVDGNNASATINVKNPDGSAEGNTMIFANENGAWKMCSPADK
ncbi:hypothetical protein [uncultured Corynebacterium sp.]|uniref:hypothetical protein n=1 Tax=uncultured Corynebacterium sp. TaxID=159447 RepID=UPI0025FF8469|nr:hypothetical protein [uncultured Corynebacterium sp.]